jgi:hypothetical protein
VSGSRAAGRPLVGPAQQREAGVATRPVRRRVPFPGQVKAGLGDPVAVGGEYFAERGGLSGTAPPVREDDGRRALPAIARVTVLAQLKPDQLLDNGEQLFAVVEQRTPSRRE